MKKRKFILLIFLVSSILANAQNYLEINSIDSANNSIKNFISVLKDTSKQLNLNQVRSDYLKDFILLNNFTEELSVKNDYWLHLKIKNNLNSKISIGLFIPKENNLITVFSLSDNQIITQKTGLYCKVFENDEIVPFTNIIKLRDTKTIEIFIRIQSINDELPRFLLKIISVNDKIRKNNQYVIFEGIVQGLLWLMILYGLFLFLLNKEKLYLYYSLYVICNSIWYLWGLALGFRFFPGLPREIFPYSDAILFLSYIFYLQFIRSFLSTSSDFVKWDRLLKSLQVVLVIEVIRIPLFISITNLVVTNYIIQNIVGEIVVLFIVIVIIRIFFLKTRLAYIIGIGSSLLIIGGTLSSILFLVYLDDSVYILQQIGTILELIVFTFGISYRYWLIEKDKQEYQEKLIFQLKENAKLHEKVNRELEHKVQERTYEIREKNQVLEQQKEEIESQRDEIQNQKEIIEHKNKNLTDSIIYAQRIQEAMLPSTTILEKNLPEHFILFKPRDIVSGDFYWFRQVEKLLFIVAADCTGHGVPGAFMSMLGISQLNEIITKRDTNPPNEILNELSKRIKKSLHQQGQKDQTQDGMDIALCAINLDNKVLHFSGANNPLYLIRKNVNGNSFELIEIKADRMPVGVHPKEEQSFNCNEIALQSNDTFYVFSDGYTSQFGGSNFERFKTKRLKETLLRIQDSPMEEQKQILENTLLEWKGKNEQVDDILIIGIRFN